MKKSDPNRLAYRWLSLAPPLLTRVFSSGFFPFQITLRAFLADKLGCKPKRITKKNERNGRWISELFLIANSQSHPFPCVSQTPLYAPRFLLFLMKCPQGTKDVSRTYETGPISRTNTNFRGAKQDLNSSKPNFREAGNNSWRRAELP